MPATLNLGVVDVGYKDDGGQTTTGDVAGYLEDKYHIMRIFFELNEDFITGEIDNAVAGAIQTMAMGGPNTIELGGAMNKIEERFRDFLDSGEMHKILPESQHSQAALKGINHRKISPNTQKDQRQAFVDTGLYRAAFRSWIESKIG
jgi:hypothetical protein